MTGRSAESFAPFGIHTLEELREEARRCSLELPLSDRQDLLGEPLSFDTLSAPNRFCALPMEGCDAGADGSPGGLTFRRYRRLAEGGFGTIWIESTAVDPSGSSGPRQLRLTRANQGAFARLVDMIRDVAYECWGHSVVVILQLSHAGRFSRADGVPAPVWTSRDAPDSFAAAPPPERNLISDDALDQLRRRYADAARLAEEAGFDGVDIKACYGCLLSDLLGAVSRPGKYGGSAENRSRFLRDVIADICGCRAADFLAAARISFDAFSVDPQEQASLACLLKGAGVRLVGVAADMRTSSDANGVHPIEKFMRLAASAHRIAGAVPGIPVMTGGMAWFRHFIPDVAAGLIDSGSAAMVGFGRSALAYPHLACDILGKGALDPEKCCINCDACVQLLRDGGCAGCAVMDRDPYAAEYRRCRYHAHDNLRAEARRCRGCEPAPCSAGCPNHIDVPAFLSAFADERLADAYAILRSANAMPGMCSHLCPVNALCEGPCTAAVLDGRAVPIHDIQYAVCCAALDRAITGVRIPDDDAGRRVAVVGAGPAGISCAVSLLEAGCRVVIYERSSKLGGTPELLIRSSRFAGAREEAEQLLRPALHAARLTVRYGMELGVNLTVDELRRDFDAVFLACGVWGELSLGKAEGVLPSLDFLLRVKSGRVRNVSGRVVLLAGGDSAMDCARLCMELGCEELLVVYPGALSEMHWHMEDSWFRTPGVHFLAMTRPVAYRADEAGKLEGLCVEKLLAVGSDGHAPATEFLKSGCVIEAMGLTLEPHLKNALPGLRFTEQGLVGTVDVNSFDSGIPALFVGGGMVNGGASVSRCVAEGMGAARQIADFLGLNKSQ